MSLLTLIQADTDTSSFSPELKTDEDKDFRPSIDECEVSGHQKLGRLNNRRLLFLP